uniref:IgGFc_binding domain-containing protein n=1 Tax=Steinernema glaseri TaxID=37863 RepID=A0A1I7Y867_9BILA
MMEEGLSPVDLSPHCPPYSIDEFRPKLHKYMADPEKYNCYVALGYPRTAQKSYGRERRLLMCYPAVVLSGGGWSRRVELLRGACNIADCQIHRSASVAHFDQDHTKRTYVSAEMMTTNGEVWRIPEAVSLDMPAMAQLRINDTAEDVSVKATLLKLRLFYNGCDGATDIGVFTSKPISVVSKPHRSAGATPVSNLSFKSGDVITLSVRSTKMTRNLCVTNSKISGDLPYYSTFTIHLVDEEMEESGQLRVIVDEPITYGSVVKLVDTESNIGLPKMRILRADERGIDLATEPGVNEVLHFHRAAFQFLDRPNTFLGLDDNDYQSVRSKPCVQPAFLSKVGLRLVEPQPTGTWLLIPHETITYSFAEIAGCADGPVTPAPLFQSCMQFAKGEYGVINGIGFTPRLQAYLDDIPLDTFYKNSESLICHLPSDEERAASNRRLRDAGVLAKSQLYLVRDDGVIYPSKLMI